MRLAICFYGNVGGKKSSHGQGGDQDISNYLKKNVFFFKKKYSKIDYFVHSWSEDRKEQIINIIKPKKYIFEKNENLNNHLKTLEDYGLRNLKSYEKIFGDEFKDFFKINFFSSQSRWYSNSKVIELMKIYSEENNVLYDWVLQTRLDIYFYKYLNIEKLNSSKFYVPIRENEKNIAINDMFFLSNYENAISFSSIFNRRNLYSIRPPVAAKQHLDYLKIDIVQIMSFQKDFNIVRLIDISFFKKVFIIVINIFEKFIFIQKKILKGLRERL